MTDSTTPGPARDGFDDATPLIGEIALSEMGGDPVCWAHLLCPSCGAVLGADSQHAPGCDEAVTGAEG
ncbi:MAG TPA: hypothetical protein VMV53_03255 [Acidimicrobiales bacterium]|nr:hypothetical protein [Acidimicrobiales bacterium]